MSRLHQCLEALLNIVDQLIDLVLFLVELLYTRIEIQSKYPFRPKSRRNNEQKINRDPSQHVSQETVDTIEHNQQDSSPTGQPEAMFQDTA
jgi:hypothetical protein